MLDEEGLNALLAAKRRDRLARIEALELAGRACGIHRDSRYWQTLHDLDFAPVTTNLKQLNELGIEVPPSWMLDSNELVNTLEEVILGLSILGIYLLHTGHLSNEELYERLREHVLPESVRELVPQSECCEWLDMCACDEYGLRVSDLWWKFFASNEQRSEAIARGVDIPDAQALKSHRDEVLPRPGFPGFRKQKSDQ